MVEGNESEDRGEERVDETRKGFEKIKEKVRFKG